MIKKSLNNTILINVSAFLLVFILETLSVWTIKDNLDPDFPYLTHGFNYALVIMIIIWVNHFALIPAVLDKKRYFLYGILLFCGIFTGAYIRGFSSGGYGVSKMFFFLIYTTGTGMAVFFLRRSIYIYNEKIMKKINCKKKWNSTT